MKKLIYIFLVHAFCVVQVLGAGSTIWRSSHITNEDGLSNSAINTIFKDSRGFMWFGTWDGLNRFDGKNIKTFYPDLYDEHTISNNIIRNMLEDGAGNLWVVTERGLNKYSHDLEKFRSWFTDFPELSLQEQSLKAVKGIDGHIWVNVHGQGIYSYDAQYGDFSKVVLEGMEYDAFNVVDDFYVHNDYLHVLREDSLVVYAARAGKRIEALYLPDLYSLNAYPVIDHSWFLVYNQRLLLFQSLRQGGLLVIDLMSRQSRVIQKGAHEFRVTSVSLPGQSQYLWMGTDDGNIFRMFPEKDYQVESVLSKIPQLAGKKVKIWTILESSDDLLWIGTDGEGVFRTVLKPKPFYQIGRGDPRKGQLNHQIVRAIHEDDQGDLWVGTRGNGLNRISARTGHTYHYTTQNGLTNNAVLSLQEDQNGYLWIGHDGMGIDLMHKESGRFYHFPADLQGAENLEFGSVYDVCIDVFGYIWLGTSGYGVVGMSVSERNGTFYLDDLIHIKGEGAHCALGSNIVYAIVEEAPNILWIATRGAGIYRMNTLSGKLDNYGVGASQGQGMGNDDVLSLYMGRNGYLWVGTSGGLSKVNINYTPYAFTHYTMHDGLPNNTIHAILEDSQGNIWCSTNKGLSKLLIDEERFLNFNSGDGLQSNEYTDGAALLGTQSGKFYFGGINGLDWFYPEQITVSENEPTLIFTGFRLYNQDILPGDSTWILKKNLNELKEITLRHDQNFFTIGFTTLNFINPDKTLFAYKLEGFHSEWVFAADQREASFTNVPYGRYQLLVQATNEDGVWSTETRQLTIVIKPPFWKTWPAFVLYVLCIAALVYWVYRYQINRIQRKQQRELERIQQEKEKELNRYKLEFFTNMAHEFGTPLTLIFASAASLLNPKRKGEEASKLVQTIYKNSRRMQRLVQELLEFRKVDTGREKLSPAKTEVVNTLSNIVGSFTLFARENEVEISFEPVEDELWVWLDSGKLEKVMLNLLSNAIKYTPAGGSIKVEMCTKDNHLIIQVSDTGVGIPAEVQPYIFDSFYQYSDQSGTSSSSFKGIGIGLTYSKSLMTLMGGGISFKSVAGQGTIFTLTLPCELAEPEPSASATGLVSQSHLLDTIADRWEHQKSDATGKQQLKPALWTTPKKYRILVAEDDPELSNLLLNLLSDQYEVSLVSNGKQALDFINHKRVDLLVSDIMMPQMDGLQLCKTLKSDVLTSHIPVVLLTAKTELENRIEGLEMGADSYIPKPFHPRHLFVRIEKLLKAREQVSEYFKTNFGTPAYDLQQDFSQRDRALLEKCISFIEKNYSRENLDADQLASHLALSKAQLYRKIKALTGLTPHGLIKNYRLKQARQMIAQGIHSISDIIFMTGFNNRTYFYRSYKEVFGETPGEFVRH